jgi:hypothetical protein
MEILGFDLTGAFTFLFQLIGVVFNFVFGLFLILSGYLVNVATTFNFNILSESNAILKTGWLAARDIANLGFVILAMGSALATVLRYPPEYDVRKLLPKFIAAAILVNFSMTLAAIPIQFSNVLTRFFLSRVTAVNDPGITVTSYSQDKNILIDLAGPLVGILGPQKLLTGETDPLPPEPGDSAGGAISAVVFASLATLIFNIIFTLLMAILLLAFAVMLISRYFVLTFLIIFAPLACLFYIFPALKDKWSLWNSEYIKWVFIGPSMMFFVYMAIVVAEKLPSTSLKGGGGLIMSGLGGLLEQFINLSFITAILVMGLIAAGKTGTAAGKGALGAANALGGGAKKFLKERKDKFMESGAQSGPGQWLQKKLKSTSESLDVKEGDSFRTKLWKKGLATTGVGQTVAVVGGNKKGLFGTLKNEMLVGAGLKDKKDKPPESRKDVEKELGELQKQRASMISGGLEVKDVDEKIKVAQRKLYKFRREELEADYSQSTEDDLDKAIGNADQGKKPSENVKEESDIKIGKFGTDNKSGIESIDLNKVGEEEKQAQEIINNEKQIKDDLKIFTKGIQKDPNDEKSEVIQTISRNKLKEEKKTISEKTSKLKELKKAAEQAKNKEALKTYEKALGIMQNAEYALDNEIKRREEEIQTLGTIRRQRENSEQQVFKATKGVGGKNTLENALDNGDIDELN